MTDQINFNTGRLYTDEGQWITAKVLDSVTEELIPGVDITTLTVRFDDHSRCISGIIKVEKLTPEAVMREYDEMRYEQV